MYHGTECGSRKPASRYSIHASRFVEHLELLDELGWRTATVRECVAHTSLSPKTAIITFDDGYANNYEGAFRYLLERGMRATWFIVTGCVGGHADWLGGRSPETRMMGRMQLAELAEFGMEIGAHTRTHPDLTSLPPTRLEDEVGGSRKELEDILGRQINSFAYPYGKYDEHSVQAVRQAGFRFACTVRPGWLGSESNPHRLRRVTVFSTDTRAELARKLAFADNDVGWRRLAGYAITRTIARLVGKH